MTEPERHVVRGGRGEKQGGSVGHTWRTLREAVDWLATGTTTIQDRVADAALPLLILRPDQLPEEQRETFIEVMGALKGVEDITAIARAMTDEQAVKWAGRVLGMFDNAAIARGREYQVTEDQKAQ